MSNRSTPPHLLIPSTLPILPLTTGILFPKLVVTVPINSRQSLELLKSVILEAEEAPLGLDGRRRRPIVGCVPLKHGSGGGDAKDPANADPSNELQVIKVPDDAARDGTLPVSDDAGAHDRRTSPDDLFGWGCAARIVRIERVNDSSYRTTLEGLSRVRIERFTQFVPSIEAKVTVFAEQGLPHTAAPLLNSLRDVSQDLLGALEKLSLPPLILKRIRAFISGVTLSGAGSLADVMVAAADVPISEKLDILATPSPEERVTRVVELLHQQKEVVDVTRKIGEKVSKNLSRRQREFFLRQQLEAIRQELAELEGKEGGSGSSPSSSSSASDFIKRLGGGGAGAGSDEEQDELKELENKIQAAQMPPEALQMTLREYKRLRRTPPLLAEHHVLKSYLETMVDLPWGRGTPSDAMLDPEFVGRARKQLDDDHYGMDKVKRRLLEYLAVMRLRGEVEAAARAEAEKIEQEKRELQEASESSGVLADALQGKEAEVNGLLDSKVGPIETSPAAAPPPPAPAQVPEKDAENVKPKAVNKSPILLLVGPPGVGKTSIAKSLATSMGRKFQRISLGGVRDEAEIRGHRRTYVGSMPGLIAQTLRKVGVNNPVILLDEIDKVSSHSFHGDPSAALLEVLDPEQNFSFGDHYINTPIDLSTVLFIATANTLETISAPLLDRMEVIELSGYTYDEKLAIAKRYLLPKQVEANVMKPEHVQISDDALVHLITAYTREAGVRTLEREIGSVCRAKAVEYAETRNSKEKEYNPIVTVDDLTKILGVEKFEAEIADQLLRPGVATGMAYQGSGNGSILFIEAQTFPGNGNLKLTGSLGDVISESAQIALSWVKSHAWELALTANRNENILDKLDVHIHLPSGSIKKDGPSAGVAMVCCLVSLLSGASLDPRLAMTGEITLRGQVTAVGGIREKALAAHRAGVTRLILPFRNRKDVEADLPERVKKELSITFVRSIHEALEAAFGDRLWDNLDLRGWAGKEERRRRLEVVESRL